MKPIGKNIWALPQPANREITWLYMDEPGPLFLRGCDIEMCEQVIFPRILKNPNRRRGNIITGTPGIGKSVMTNWVIAMIRSYFKEKDIYLFHSLNNLQFLIKSNGRCFELTPEQYKYAVQRDKDAIILADTGGEKKDASYLHAGYIMVTASPRAIPKELYKESNVELAFLEPWNREDVRAMFDELSKIQKYESIKGEGPQFEELMRRYEFAGGVPRVLFGNLNKANLYDSQVSSAISDAVKDVNPDLDVFKSEHKVLHSYPRHNLYDYSLKFATPDVSTRFDSELAKRTLVEIKMALSSLTHTGVQVSMLQTCVGVLYESSMHEVLATSFSDRQENIEWRPSEKNEKIDLGLMKKIETDEPFKAAKINSYEAKTYYVPKSSNQPVIDAWIKKGNVLFLLQMTEQETRNLGSTENNFFKEISEAQQNIEIRFVYVAPFPSKGFQINDKREGDTKVQVKLGVLEVNEREAVLDPLLKERTSQWRRPE